MICRYKSMLDGQYFVGSQSYSTCMQQELFMVLARWSHCAECNFGDPRWTMILKTWLTHVPCVSKPVYNPKVCNCTLYCCKIGKLLLQANCLLYEANCYCRFHYIYRSGLHNHGVISAILPSFHLHSTMRGKLSKFLFKYSRITPTLVNWSGGTIFKI